MMTYAHSLKLLSGAVLLALVALALASSDCEVDVDLGKGWDFEDAEGHTALLRIAMCFLGFCLVTYQRALSNERDSTTKDITRCFPRSPI